MRHVQVRSNRLKPLVEAGPFTITRKANQLRVLVVTSIGAHPTAFRVDSLIGNALAKKGCQVSQLFCDGALQACQDCEYRWISSETNFVQNGAAGVNCGSCKKTFQDNAPDITALKFTNYIEGIKIPTIPVEEMLDYRHDGINIGEHTKSGALRFLAKGQLDLGSSFERDVVKKYFVSSLKAQQVAKNIFNDHEFDRIIIHHGIYVPQGVFMDVARQFNQSIYCWATGYRHGTLVWAKGDTYHRHFAGDINGWDDFHFSEEKQLETERYLASRENGKEDWISWNREASNSIFDDALNDFIARHYGKVYTCFTNVFWDAQIHFSQSIFRDMLDWIVQTIQFAKDNPEIGLIIRIHPAEITGSVPSRQLLDEELEKYFGSMPSNVHVISPASKISSYALGKKSNIAIVYGSKIGMELAAIGVPTVVVGDAWVSSKNITCDPKSKTEYFSKISTLSKVRAANNQSRALKFCYWYFFKKMIKVDNLDSGLHFAPIELAEPYQHNDGGLNLITDAIISNSDIINAR